MSMRSEVIKIFEPKGPPLGSEGAVDLVKGFPSPVLVILQNLVALFHTMLLYVGLICQIDGSWAYDGVSINLGALGYAIFICRGLSRRQNVSSQDRIVRNSI